MMSREHMLDSLSALLAGEADRDTVRRAAAHLPGCDDCLQELGSVLVAHAALVSAAKVAATPGKRAITPPEPDVGSTSGAP